MNYWDIVANKGSYESLTNSLKWFEWGDLVRIEEVWKSREPHGDIYKLKPLKSQLDDYLRSQINNISKTTYIGLYYAMQHIEKDGWGGVVYEDQYNIDPQQYSNRIHKGDRIAVMEDYDDFTIHSYDPNRSDVLGKADAVQSASYSTNIIRRDIDSGNYIYNEPNPQLDNIAALWNNIDLCLKMTLLGNFYSTFFMPVHLDLIHSTIESWVFTNTIKLLNASTVSRIDIINNTKTFDLYYEYE